VYLVGDFIGWDKIGNKIIDNKISPRHWWFLNEVVSITGVRHKNLVKLKGCCLHHTQRLLVYEYVENKNLAEALRGIWPTFTFIVYNVWERIHDSKSTCIMIIDPWSTKDLIFYACRFKYGGWHILGLANTISYSCGHCSRFSLLPWRLATMHYTLRHQSIQHPSYQQLKCKNCRFWFGTIILWRSKSIIYTSCWNHVSAIRFTYNMY
jgi:hypothetical protein